MVFGLLTIFIFIAPLYAEETGDLTLEEVVDETADNSTEFTAEEVAVVEEVPLMIERRVIFIKPELIIEGSLEHFIFNETETVFEKMEAEGQLGYLHEGEWRRYRGQLNYEDYSLLSDFNLNTGVTGAIRIFVTDSDEATLQVKVNIFDFLTKKSSDYKFYLKKDRVDAHLISYKERLQKLLATHFPPEDYKQKAKRKYRIPPFVRVNPDYQLALSGGAGFNMKQVFSPFDSEPGVYGLGPLFYFRLDSSIRRFNLRFQLEGGPLFYEPFQAVYGIDEFSLAQTYTSQDGPIPSLFTSIDFGGWFKNHILKIGGGFGFGYSSIYHTSKEDLGFDMSGYHKVDRRIEFINYMLVFAYMNFTLQPYRTVLISLDIGGFLSPDKIDRVTPTPFIPFYFRLLFRYYFYQGLFWEFTLPFYALDRDEGSPAPNVIFMLGLGWRFEWRRR